MGELQLIRGTWVALIAAGVLLVAAAMASAAPTYPVAQESSVLAGPAIVPATPGASDGIAPRLSSDGRASDGRTAGPRGGGTADREESGAKVTGDSNHGQVVRDVAGTVEGPASGCAISGAARSDAGKPLTSNTDPMVPDATGHCASEPDATGVPSDTSKTTGPPDSIGAPDAPGQGNAKQDHGK